MKKGMKWPQEKLWTKYHPAYPAAEGDLAYPVILKKNKKKSLRNETVLATQSLCHEISHIQLATFMQARYFTCQKIESF